MTLKIKRIFNKEEAKLALSQYLEVDKSLIQINDQTGLLYYSEKKRQVSEMHLMMSGSPTYTAYKGATGTQYYIRQVT